MLPSALPIPCAPTPGRKRTDRRVLRTYVQTNTWDDAARGKKSVWANRASERERHACVLSLADGEHRKNIHIIEDFTVIHQTKDTHI